MIIAAYLAAGLLLLYFGAEWLVKGSSNVALRAGVPSLVVGLTIVAFGTSAPELVVSIKAGLDGLGNIAVGNVVGSNIFNIAVILGISAIISPMKVNVQILKMDAPLMIGASILLLFLLYDHNINRIDGAILTIGIIAYTWFTIHMGKKNGSDAVVAGCETASEAKKKPVVLEILLIVLGLGALVLGSRFFVKGAVDIAHIFNISDAIIGLTIVAAGTSLPELATSVVAAVKGEEDIAIGNIIGSNIFNILSILGIAGLVKPLDASGISIVDLSVMLGTAILLIILMRTGYSIRRKEGALLILVYLGYLVFLWPK